MQQKPACETTCPAAADSTTTAAAANVTATASRQQRSAGGGLTVTSTALGAASAGGPDDDDSLNTIITAVGAGAEGGSTAAAEGAAQEADDAVAECWEHSQEGWEDLLQRAWQGDVQAVLACAQELIHGGAFCLQDFSLARQLLRTTLHQPCGTACLWLGQLAERGFGLPAPDYTEAAAWYGRGAALGHLECALALAFYYQHGLGLAQDVQAAMEWLVFAAEGGLPAAQNNLAQLLLNSDPATSMQLFQAAAEQGSATAWYNLGVCHEQGCRGSCPDLAAAEACYQQAATPKALLRLGHVRLQQHAHTVACDAFRAAANAGCAVGEAAACAAAAMEGAGGRCMRWRAAGDKHCQQ